MIAITVTQELKDLNAELFKNNEVGTIKQLSKIPNSFYSLNYFLGQRTDGYHTLTSIHNLDGFFDVVIPAYNTEIEKLGSLFFDQGI